MSDKYNKSIWAKLNANRIYWIFAIVFVSMCIFAPKFFNAYNINTILGTVMLNGIVSIGFTIVLICGHLDLSTVSVINMAGNVTIFVVQKTNNFFLAILAAMISGLIVGVLNGLLVTKGKINSFIATLGMMILIQGLVYFANNAATLSIKNFAATDFLDAKLIFFIPNRALIVIILVVIMHLFMSYTTIGKNFYLIGGNIESAWYAGLNTDRYLISAFSFSGLFAAIGGALYSLYLASSMANIGERGISPLMIIIAATVLGGASLSGGKGSILNSYFGVLTLTTIFNGLNCFKLGYETQIFISGIVLMIVIMIEASSAYRRNKLIGSKQDLFKHAT